MTARSSMRPLGIRLMILAAVLQILLPAWAFARPRQALEPGAICAWRDGGAPERERPPATHDHACSLCPVCAVFAAVVPPDASALPVPKRLFGAVRFATPAGVAHGAPRTLARARAPPVIS
jgi:hypothetical protein